MATLEEIKAALAERGSELPTGFLGQVDTTSTETSAPVGGIDSLMKRAKVLGTIGGTTVIANPEDFTEPELKAVYEKANQQASADADTRRQRARDMGITAADSAVLNAGTGVAKLFGLEGLESTLRESRGNLSTKDRIVSDLTGSLLPGSALAKLLTRGGKALSLGKASGAAAIEGGVSSANLSDAETVPGQLAEGATGAALGAITAGTVGAASQIPQTVKKAFNLGSSKADDILQEGIMKRDEIGPALETARKSITGSDVVNDQVKKLIDGPNGVAVLKDLKQEAIEFAENNLSGKVFNSAGKQELKTKDIFYDKIRGTFSVIKEGAEKTKNGYSETDLVEIPMSGEAFATARAKVEDKVRNGFFTQKAASGKIKSFSEADKAALGENAGLVSQYAENEQALDLLRKATTIAKRKNPSDMEVTNFLRKTLEETPNMKPLDRYKVAMAAFANNDKGRKFKPSEKFKETIANSGLSKSQQENFTSLIKDMSKSNGFSGQEFLGDTAETFTYRAALGSASLMYRLSIARSAIKFLRKFMPDANADARDRIGNELLSAFDNLSEAERQRLFLSAVDNYGSNIVDKQAETFVKSMLTGIAANSATQE